ncbi:nicotinamide phosphoribosyltransferase [Xanthomonas phage vB_XciM_LucasX]|nr:nicotinamide phosphoribosyltransferase [Xanthomonas phage vB_XciM_LucasX]
MLYNNLILNTDSYKASHWTQYPANTETTFFYAESRGGVHDQTVFFGLQTILMDYLSRPITHADVDEARDLFAGHGEPFNEAGWRYIVDTHGGFLPVRIRAVAEGTVVPTHNALYTVESTDPACYWVPSYLETLLMRTWYTTTVATVSWACKQVISKHLYKTCDAPEEQLPFKLHDFGARGVSSTESSALGGLAHLVNFQGTDTVLALVAARRYYHCEMAGYSVPAAEHATITPWGRAGEVEAYRNMLKQFGREGGIVSVVSDSYDIFNAVSKIWGNALRQEVIDSGATLVIRPDSGEPVEIVLECLERIDAAFGHTINAKGFKVLNQVRVLQGDGIDPAMLEKILEASTAQGYSAENLVFGMGGGLLQKVNRDTQKFALKCSAALVNGQWIDVYKDPITDSGKRSKRGRLSLFRHREYGTYRTLRLDEPTPAGFDDVMVTVWENGKQLVHQTLADIRLRADALRRK